MDTTSTIPTTTTASSPIATAVSHAKIFVIDTSDSMGTKDNGSDCSRLDAAKKGTLSRISEGEPTQTAVKIVPFNVNAILNYCDVKRANDPLLANQVNALEPGHSTAIWTSLEQVIDSFQTWFPQPPSIVDLILLTDGDDNSSHPNTKAKFAWLEKLIGAKGTLKCVVFSINTSTNKSKEYQTFLDEMKTVLPT